MEKSLVHLVRRKTRQPVEAELWDDITEDHVNMWQADWLPVINQHRAKLESTKTPLSKWPQDLDWCWDKKTEMSRGLLSFRRFSLICDDKLQCLMLVNLTKLSGRLQGQSGKDLVYVEFLSTAPWNRNDISPEPVFSGAGLIMIRTCVELSIAEGLRGRIGLHSLAQAEQFYQRCGMTEMGVDPDCDDLKYFEMTEEQAKAFRG